MAMLMEPNSGVVMTEEEWRAEYAHMDPELWGGENFEDAELVEVVRTENGDWAMA